MNNRNRSQISAGIILIGLGALFLLNTFGIIRKFNWELLFRFWPVIIILIGLNLVFKDTPLWWLTTVIFVLGIIALFFFNTENTYRYPLIEDNGERYNSKLELDQAIEKLEIDLNIGAGRLILDKVINDGNLYELQTPFEGRRPSVEYWFDKDIKKAYLTINQNKGVNFFPSSRKNIWELKLAPRIIHSIEINAGAGEFNLNLTDIVVEELKINSGAGDLLINCGEDIQFIKLNSAAANVKLNIPEDKAIKIKTAGLISDSNFNRLGLKKINDSYQSGNYLSEDDKLLVEINAPASKIELGYYRVN